MSNGFEAGVVRADDADPIADDVIAQGAADGVQVGFDPLGRGEGIEAGLGGVGTFLVVDEVPLRPVAGPAIPVPSTASTTTVASRARAGISRSTAPPHASSIR